MRKATILGAAVTVLAVVGGVSPRDAAAREAGVCQFYKGDPLCRTVEESNCLNVGLGESCRTTTDYWYWS